MISGLIGIGGGIVMVPAMVYFLSMSQHKAQGTSLLAIIPTALVGATSYAAQGYMNMNFVIWIAIGGFFGAFIGSSWAGKISEKRLKIVYAVFLVIVGIKMMIG